MHAFPAKVAVSNSTSSGGRPSGAGLMWTLDPVGGAAKSALSDGTSAVMRAASIDKVHGVSRDRINLYIRDSILGN